VQIVQFVEKRSSKAIPQTHRITPEINKLPVLLEKFRVAVA
jgi:hypothetical protein